MWKLENINQYLKKCYVAFHQHVKHVHLQSLIFNQADNAIIEMGNSEDFR